MKKETISVIGLGKLGSPLAACLASKGHCVIGVDSNPKSVEKANQGLPPVLEPLLEELFKAHQANIKATLDVESAVLNSDISFVVVPTPSDESGAYELSFVLAAMKQLGAALKRKTQTHLVVLSSTVLPGAMRDQIAPALEAHSGKVCGRDFGLCYSPMFIALGSVVHDILNPDFILVGESDEESGKRLGRLYEQVCDNRPPVVRMNWFNAELSKVAVNSFVTMKISFANTLAEICEKVPEADVAAITGALGLDKRIGAKYLKGALGFGGPCFPRDNAAFTYMARQLGVDPLLAAATDQINHKQVKRLEQKAVSLLPSGGSVAILGLAYKPETSVVEESQGLLLAQSLIAKGIAVRLYDPLANENARAALHGKGTWAQSARECIGLADVVVITNPCAEFKTLEEKDFRAGAKKKAVIDCWRVLDRSRLGEIQYVALGAGEGNLPDHFALPA